MIALLSFVLISVIDENTLERSTNIEIKGTQSPEVNISVKLMNHFKAIEQILIDECDFYYCDFDDRSYHH